MASSRESRRAVVAAAALFVVGAVGASVWLATRHGSLRTDSFRRGFTRIDADQGLEEIRVHPRLSAAERIDQEARGRVGSDGRGRGAGGADADLAAAFDDALAAMRPPAPAPPGGRPREILDRARARGVARDPISYRMDLERSLDRAPALAAGAAEMLVSGMSESDGPLLFQTAIALAARLDRDPAARARLIEGARRAPAATRPFALLALRGSSDPEAARAIARAYVEEGDPAAREAAAFALADRAPALPPEERREVRGAAWRDLHSGNPGLERAAADVLGAGPLEPEDRRRLLALVHDESAPGERRLQALRALATAGLDPADAGWPPGRAGRRP